MAYPPQTISNPPPPPAYARKCPLKGLPQAALASQQAVRVKQQLHISLLALITR